MQTLQTQVVEVLGEVMRRNKKLEAPKDPCGCVPVRGIRKHTNNKGYRACQSDRCYLEAKAMAKSMGVKYGGGNGKAN